VREPVDHELVARLGAQVSGGDVDPLAVRIVTRELAPANTDVVRDAGTDMLVVAVTTVVAVLLVAAIAGLLIYTQTDGFRRMVEEKALAAINQAINGAIAWDRMEGSVLGNLTIYDLRLRYRAFLVPLY
jgi:hypothetical protein